MTSKPNAAGDAAKRAIDDFAASGDVDGGQPSAAGRRRFLTRVLAASTGALVILAPLAAGVAFFLDPFLRKARPGTSSGRPGRDGEGYLRVTTLASLPPNGRPKLFTVYDDIVDAWNKFVNQPVGRVYLRKRADGQVTAFNVRCPHLGCAVDYRAAQGDYFCPCHTSAFNLDGHKKNEIPPRGMDALDVKIVEGSEVWVRYESFKAGTPDKTALPMA